METTVKPFAKLPEILALLAQLGAQPAAESTRTVVRRAPRAAAIFGPPLDMGLPVSAFFSHIVWDGSSRTIHPGLLLDGGAMFQAPGAVITELPEIAVPAGTADFAALLRTTSVSGFFGAVDWEGKNGGSLPPALATVAIAPTPAAAAPAAPAAATAPKSAKNLFDDFGD